ncbi:hypothetical protein Tco_1291326, partial [Tanacetum coccineum]
MAEPKTTTLRLHYCRQLQVLRDGEFEFWPTCDPTMKSCNEGDRIYGLDEHGALKQWHCHLDNQRRCMKGRNILIPVFFFWELRFGKKGYILDDIWEKCKHVHRGTLYSWHNDGFEEEERQKSGLDGKYYDTPPVCIETFE